LIEILKFRGEDKGTSYLHKSSTRLHDVDPLDIDLIIMGTATPDMPVAALEFMWLLGSYERFCLTCRQLVPVFVWNVCCLSLCSIWKIKKVLLIGADKILS
jgi:3-oxoacyl-[acyl-carrier-protein] synthase-3